MNDLLPVFFLSLVMSVIVWGSVSFVSNNLLKLVIGVLVGVVFYLAIAKIFRMDELDDLISLVKSKKQ